MVQRRRRLIVPEVAADALGAEPDVNTRCRPMVALIARHRRVGAEQRKPVVVILDGRNLHIPTLHGVALLAVRPELATVQVRMTFRALGGRLRKNQADVTVLARDRLVQAAQRKTGLRVVIEFHLLADRLPGSRGVTVLARHLQRPVWVRHPAAHCILRQNGNRGNR